MKRLSTLTRFGAPPLLIWALFTAGITYPPVDFSVYYRAAAQAQPEQDIYAENIHSDLIAPEGLPYVYTPFTLLLLKPFTLLPEELAWLTWTTLCVALLYRLLLRAGLNRLKHKNLVFWAALASSVITQHLVFGQINLILAFLCFTDLARPGTRRLPRGLLTGIAAGIKLTPAFFCLYLLVTKQYRAFSWSLVGGGLTLLLGALAYPVSTFTYFTHEIANLSSKVDLGQNFATSGNNSLAGALAFLAPTLPTGVLTALTLALALTFLALAKRLQGLNLEPLALSIVGLGANIISPVSWVHHWVFLVVLAVQLLTLPSTKKYGLALLTLLIFHPTDLGDYLLSTDLALAALPGILLREALLLAAGASAILLYLRTRGGSRARL